MKLSSCALLMTIPLLFSGCLREDPNPPPRPLAHECTLSDATAPLWACGISTQKSGMLTVAAKVQARHAGEALSFKKVRPSLRKGLRKQLQKNIEKRVDRYVQQNGGFNETTARSVSAKICSEVAYDLTAKLREVDRWQDPAGENVYILTGIEDEYVDHTIKRYGAKEMIRLSPLEKWVLLRTAMNENGTKTAMKAIPAQPQTQEPPFMVEEPMVEVVDDSFVGINKRR